MKRKMSKIGQQLKVKIEDGCEAPWKPSSTQLRDHLIK